MNRSFLRRFCSRALPGVLSFLCGTPQASAQSDWPSGQVVVKKSTKTCGMGTVKQFHYYMHTDQETLQELKKLFSEGNAIRDGICDSPNYQPLSDGLKALIIQRVKVVNTCEENISDMFGTFQIARGIPFIITENRVLGQIKDVLDYGEKRQVAGSQAKKLAANTFDAAASEFGLYGKAVKLVRIAAGSGVTAHLLREVISDAKTEAEKSVVMAAVDPFESVARRVRAKFDAAHQSGLPKFLTSYECQ